MNKELIFRVEKCWKCKGTNLYKPNDDFILCLDCGEYYEVVSEKIDKLSFWIYKREYVKYKKKKDKLPCSDKTQNKSGAKS